MNPFQTSLPTEATNMNAAIAGSIWIAIYTNFQVAI